MLRPALIGGILGTLLALVSGCATSPTQTILGGRVVTLTLADSISAQDVLSRSQNLLPPGDPWFACMATIQGMLMALQTGPGAPETTNGILTEASRLHVLDAMMSQASTNPGQQTCAQIILAIQLRMAAGATPGGALLPLR